MFGKKKQLSEGVLIERTALDAVVEATIKQAPKVSVLALSVAATNAMAATTDYSSLTSAVDWSTVGAAIIGVFAAGAAVVVAFVGGKFILRAIRGA